MLNDTRVSDAGIYRCMVNNPPEITDPGIGELVLSVLGKLLRVEQLAEALAHYDHLPKQELVIHLSFFFLCDSDYDICCFPNQICQNCCGFICSANTEEPNRLG